MWFRYVTLRRGAHGPAVAEVRRRLYRLGHLSWDGGSEYDAACETAVKNFQRVSDVKPDGVVGPATWRELYGHSPSPEPTSPRSPISVWAPAACAPTHHASACIEISIANRTLALQDGKGCRRTFPVAVGRPLSPTPTGLFTVAQLVHNPGGPLGTRWLRLRPGTCSIHGTNEPWTVGADVTPGCVRLYNKDVEIVFHRVHIGTPVVISQS